MIELLSKGRLTKLLHILLPYEPMLRRSILLIVMFAIPLAVSINATSSKFDPDGWWHLRTGQWIVENRMVPLTDSFSIMDGTRWIAYSWAYELVLYGLYSAFGLSGFVIYGIVMSLTITFALYSLLRAISGRIVLTVALTSAGILALLPMLHIRSFMFSISFLILEMWVLYRVKATSNVRLLPLLPLLFVLWANIHIQFVFGLFVYVMMSLEIISDALRSGTLQRQNQKKRLILWLVGVGLTSGLATLATPYHFHIYLHLFDIVRQPEFYKYISELQSPRFRSIDTWAILFITLSAAFAIGWRKNIRPFTLILFGVATIIGFRSHRDAWFTAIIGVAILTHSLAGQGEAEESGHSKSLVFICLAVIILLSWFYRGVTNENLIERVSRQYPAAAAEFVVKQGYPGPVYNHFNWGGYLIWKLPQRLVSMDGRGYLYGSKRFVRGARTWLAKPDWQDDQDLKAARTIIASPKWGLTAVLRLHPRFQMVYEDSISVVFVAVASDETFANSREDELQ